MWQRIVVRLACGCGITPDDFDRWEPGDTIRCQHHDEQEVVRVSRVREERGSRDAKLGLAES